MVLRPSQCEVDTVSVWGSSFGLERNFEGTGLTESGTGLLSHNQSKHGAKHSRTRKSRGWPVWGWIQPERTCHTLQILQVPAKPHCFALNCQDLSRSQLQTSTASITNSTYLQVATQPCITCHVYAEKAASSTKRVQNRIQAHEQDSVPSTRRWERKSFSFPLQISFYPKIWVYPAAVDWKLEHPEPLANLTTHTESGDGSKQRKEWESNVNVTITWKEPN